LIIDDLSATVWDSGLEAMETFGGGYDFKSASPGTTTTASVCASFALLRASVFRTFEGILVRRRGDFLAIRNLFQERGILWRSLELVSGANRWRDEVTKSKLLRAPASASSVLVAITAETAAAVAAVMETTRALV
jgi:hypothetical protein